jgi:glycosyltransferase involved in cell wall biosynthesis
MSESLNISISVVLPALNEAGNLSRVVTDAAQTLNRMQIDWEIIVVDDGSADTTSEVARNMEMHFPSRIKLIQHQTNKGYGAALQSGFQAATKTLLFFTDADGQFSFEDFPQFVACLGVQDMVLGERSKRRDPWHRKLNSKIGNYLARAVLGIRVRDINCAYKLFRTSLVKMLPLESEGALINTELLAFAHRLSWSYVQVPVRHLPRICGKPTGAKFSVIVRTFAEYFVLRKRLDSAVIESMRLGDGLSTF